MPKDYIYETAVTIDYEEKKTYVDTTVKRVASYLLRRGFTETTTPGSKPYRRFIRNSTKMSFPSMASRVGGRPNAFKKGAKTT